MDEVLWDKIIITSDPSGDQEVDNGESTCNSAM